MASAQEWQRPNWQVGDEVWAVFRHAVRGNETRRIGVVRSIGSLAFSVRLDKPRAGESTIHVDYTTEGYFRTARTGGAWCKQNAGI